MKRRKKILQLLTHNKELSCVQITSILLETESFSNESSYRRRYANMTASLSGTLNQMVKQGILNLSENKTARGGKIYKLKKNQYG